MIKMQVSVEMIMHAFFISLSFLLVYLYRRQETGSVTAYHEILYLSGKISTCGRCIDIPGLCDECGYFFVAEYTLLFSGNVKVICEMLKTYLKYV